MEDRFQLQSGGLIFENPAAEVVTIDAALIIQNLRSEYLHHLVRHSGPGLQQLVDGGVAIENRNGWQPFAQQPANRGFP